MRWTLRATALVLAVALPLAAGAGFKLWLGTVPALLATTLSALLGAWLAGAVLAVAGVGIHHRLCHLLGGAYGLPHAELHAVLLPHAARLMTPAVPAEMARVAAALGVADAAGGLWDLARRLGAPAGLAELGLAEAELDRVAELAAAKLGDAPGPPSERELRALLDDAWRGRRPQ